MKLDTDIDWLIDTVPPGIEQSGFGLSVNEALFIKAPNTRAAIALTKSDAIQLRDALNVFLARFKNET